MILVLGDITDPVRGEIGSIFDMATLRGDSDFVADLFPLSLDISLQ